METIKVRIALEINQNGEWHAHGYNGNEGWEEVMGVFDPLSGNVRKLWIEREIAVPAAEPETLEGDAVPA